MKSNPPPPAIPPAILRAGYEAERAAWQRDLAQLQARLAAQQHIAALLGSENAAHIAGIVRDMELVAIGLTKIEELIAALGDAGAGGTTRNGDGGRPRQD